MPEMVVSGRMGVLFDEVTLPVGEGEDRDEVQAWRCRWCRWTYVVDDKKLVPDHACSGPPRGKGTRSAG